MPSGSSPWAFFGCRDSAGFQKAAPKVIAEANAPGVAAMVGIPVTVVGAELAAPAASWYLRARAGAYIAKNFNGGRSRVEILGKAGKWSYDLIGKAHFEKIVGKRIPTPHKFFQPLEPRAANGLGKRTTTAPMGWRDLYNVFKYLRR